MPEVSLDVHAIQRFSSLALLCLGLPLAASAADTITGVVTNGTTKKPSAGDDVVLIRLQQGMQESTRTKTDAHGKFTLEVPDEGIHLVRVTHEKASYFRPAPPGTQSVELEVFNAAAKVKGVAEEADVMRIQTDPNGKTLKVTEHYFIKNESNPPMTQFSDKPFEFLLPAGAVIEGSAAQAPGGMAVQTAPTPLGDNHYTFIFPIRPGETQFQVTYHLPYSGKIDLSPRVADETDTIAIMLPKSMTFTPSADAPFSPVNDPEVTAQTFVARQVKPQQALAFTLSGTGELPKDGVNPDQGAQGPASAGGGAGQPVPETQNTMPGRGLQNPLDPEGNRDPWAQYKWWILGGLALLLAAGAGVLLRKPAGGSTVAAGTEPAPLHPTQSREELLLQALKEELFALETDRLQGTISDGEYRETKGALELILKRSLGRTKKAPTAIEENIPETTLTA